MCIIDSRRINSRRDTARHIIIKLLKAQDREKNLESSERETAHQEQGILIR